MLAPLGLLGWEWTLDSSGPAKINQRVAPALSNSKDQFSFVNCFGLFRQRKAVQL